MKNVGGKFSQVLREALMSDARTMQVRGGRIWQIKKTPIHWGEDMATFHKSCLTQLFFKEQKVLRQHGGLLSLVTPL